MICQSFLEILRQGCCGSLREILGGEPGIVEGREQRSRGPGGRGVHPKLLSLLRSPGTLMLSHILLSPGAEVHHERRRSAAVRPGFGAYAREASNADFTAKFAFSMIGPSRDIEHAGSKAAHFNFGGTRVYANQGHISESLAECCICCPQSVPLARFATPSAFLRPFPHQKTGLSQACHRR